MTSKNTQLNANKNLRGLYIVIFIFCQAYRFNISDFWLIFIKSDKINLLC